MSDLDVRRENEVPGCENEIDVVFAEYNNNDTTLNAIKKSRTLMERTLERHQAFKEKKQELAESKAETRTVTAQEIKDEMFR